MIPAHAALYNNLSAPQAQIVASRLLQHGLVRPEQILETYPDEDLSRIDGPTIAQWCAPLSHAQVVLALVRERDELALSALEVLIEKPIYMCAPGETSEPLTDFLGRPLPLPVGHRRGSPPPQAQPEYTPPGPRASRSVHDPRIIESIVPNPKRRGSEAYRRFNLYLVGQEVEASIRNGVTRADVRWDSKMGFITLRHRELTNAS